MSETVEFEYKNGEILRDIVSGYEGVVMVQAKYSTGCIHYGLARQGLKEDGSIADWQWIDCSRLARVEDKSPVELNLGEGMTSGPMPSGPEQ